ncbi:MAG: hypothetical protein GWP03_04790, partial [Proteobacteria bacterium]|nr:hypothetical protein [Pseudomonadota bacterium]
LPVVNPYVVAGYIITPLSKSGTYYTAGLRFDLKAMTIDLPIFYKSPDMTGFGHRIVFIFNAMGIRIGSISL